MWRHFFMAVGIMAIIVGAESLLIDSATLYAAADSSAQNFMDPSASPAQMTHTWRPSERFPWAFLVFGAVVLLYAFTLPQRFRHG